MTEHKISFFARLGLALRLLFDGAEAQRLLNAEAQGKTQRALAANTTGDNTQDAPDERQAGATLLLALLQREARFVDFVSEDISAFSDAEVGAAARAVHQGCAKVFGQHLALSPLRSEAEGAQIEIPAGYDPQLISLSGQVQGAAPYRGRLQHPGWELVEIKLPTRQGQGRSLRVITPAEVEL